MSPDLLPWLELAARMAATALLVVVATLAFCLAYILMAHSFGLIVSYLLALACWGVAVPFIQSVMWTIASALLLNLAAFAVALPIARRSVSAAMPRAVRRWYDMPFRAGLVASFVAAVVALSSHVGPAATGALAVSVGWNLFLLLRRRLVHSAARAV